MSARGCLALALWAFLCVAAVPAHAAVSITNDPEYKAAFDAMYADPANLDAAFAFASVAARKGDIEGAIGALERMLFLSPDLPRVDLELGTLYFRLGSYATAQSYFEQALKAKNLPPEVAERAQSFLNEVERQLSQNRFSGSVFAGLRYQTNATTSPSLGLVRANGLDVKLNDRFLGHDDLNAFAAFSVRHSFDFRTGGETWDSALDTYVTRQRHQSQVNLIYSELTTGPRAPLPDGLLTDVAVRPYAIFDFLALYDAPYYTAPGAGIALVAVIPDGPHLGLNLEERAKSYQNNNLRPRNNDQNGMETQLRVTLTQAIASDLSVQLAGYFADPKTRVRSQGYHLLELGAGLNYLLSPPGALTTQSWTISLSGKRASYVYDDIDQTIDPNVTRHDRDWSVEAGASVPLDSDFALISSVGHITRNSSLPNYKFDNIYLSTGLFWQF